MNYSARLDLLKIEGAFVTNISGRTATKKCVCIPVGEDNGTFLGEKGCYLNLTAYEMRSPQYGETHYFKADVGKERWQSMSPEERKAMPIVGGLRQITERSASAQVTVENAEDLPF